MKKIATILIASSLVALSPAFAAPCKDAKGKFIKCAPKMAMKAPAKTTRCRDAKGHFMKCK